MSTMCPDSKRKLRQGPHVAGNGGFAVVAAIFLLLLFAALGAFMVTFSSVQNVTSTQDIQSAKAYQAARAGIEWGIYRALRNTSCVATTPLTLAGAFAGFTVTVECVDSGALTEGENLALHIYNITSTASLGAVGSGTFVERQMRASVGN